MVIRAALVAVTLILTCVIAASAQISAEAPFSDPVYGAAPGNQTAPVVATDGLDFLVACIDARSFPIAVYANRVTHDGRVLDGTGIRIPFDPNGSNAGLVGAFFADGAYTIIYSYSTIGPLTRRTAVATISVDGRLIDGPRVVLDNAFTRAGATNGSRIVLVTGDEIVVLTGQAQIAARFALPPGVNAAFVGFGAGIASNGSTFLVGTFFYDNGSKQSAVNLIALDPSGSPTDSTRVDASFTFPGPAIGSDGTDYVVLYSDGQTFKSVTQYVGAHAAIKSTSILDSEPYSFAPRAIVWTGHDYLASATESRRPGQQITFVNLDRSGTPTGSLRRLGAATSDVVNQTAMAWNGTTALLAWSNGSQDAPEALEVLGTFTNADATSMSPFITIPDSSNMQITPVIATSGSQDLAVWAEPTGIYATRIAPDGRTLDGRGITVSSVALLGRSLTVGGVRIPNWLVEPVVRAIYDGSAFVVAWGGGDAGVTTQRIDPETGSLIGPPIVLATCSRGFDLAKDNDSLVLFTVDCGDWRLYAQRVGATAAPLGSAVTISPLHVLANAPRAAWNGTEWLIVWNELVQSGILISPPEYFSPSVYATRISPAFAPLDTQAMTIAHADFNQEDSPYVATDGHEFVVVWSHRSWDGTDSLNLRRVQPDGSVGESVVLVPGLVTARSIVRTGSRYAVGYLRTNATRDGDLFLTHIPSRDDEPLTHDEVAISTTALDERSISLVAPPGRPLRLVYTRVAAEPQYGGVSRVFMRDELSPRRRSVRQR